MNSRFDGSQMTSRSTKKRSANSLSFSMGASSMDQKQDVLTVFASFVFIAIMGSEGNDRNGHHFFFFQYELFLVFTVASSEMPSIRLLNSFRAHEGVVWYVSWSPNGNDLLTCSSDKSVKCWSRMGDTWAVKETMDGIHKKSIRACEMSPNGTFRLCAASIVE